MRFEPLADLPAQIRAQYDRLREHRPTFFIVARSPREEVLLGCEEGSGDYVWSLLSGEIRREDVESNKKLRRGISRILRDSAGIKSSVTHFQYLGSYLHRPTNGEVPEGWKEGKHLHAVSVVLTRKQIAEARKNLRCMFVRMEHEFRAMTMSATKTKQTLMLDALKLAGVIDAWRRLEYRPRAPRDSRAPGPEVFAQD